MCMPAKMQMECIELQSDIQIKENFIQVSLNSYKLHLPEEKYSALHEHVLFVEYLCLRTDLFLYEAHKTMK